MFRRELAFQLADQFRALGAGITLKVLLIMLAGKTTHEWVYSLAPHRDMICGVCLA